MAKPTKPKDLKPKVEGEVAAAPGGGGGAAFDLKYIVLIVVVVIASIVGSVGSAYLMTTLFVMPELAKVSHAPKGGEAEAGAHGEAGADSASTEEAGHEVGMNLELDEFTVNLKTDPNLEGNQFLRAKMALSIKVPEKENCYAEHKAAFLPATYGDGKIVGAAAPVDRTLIANGGEGGPSCEDVFKTNMGKFVPTIRDVINAALMKRTASSLATLEGQESLKDEIKEQLSQIMAPDYQVLRVNFQDFIIQK